MCILDIYLWYELVGILLEGWTVLCRIYSLVTFCTTWIETTTYYFFLYSLVFSISMFGLQLRKGIFLATSFSPYTLKVLVFRWEFLKVLKCRVSNEHCSLLVWTLLEVADILCKFYLNCSNRCSLYPSQKSRK